MMKAFLSMLLGVITLVALPLLHADQVNSFSVFQPINGISANIYIDNAKVMVQSTGAKTTVLKNIRPDYLKNYSEQLYKIGDVDHNGTVDIATLDTVDRAATRFCYKVYSYQLGSRQFSSRPTHTSCDSKAGTVVYATGSAVAINQ
ncbi:MAG: hypothetical protein V3U78_09755 [Thiotrichaceae bacterium]